MMIIYLTARPDRGPGLLLGLRPTRAQRRLLGLAPWRRLPVPLPRRRGTCVSLARYRYKRLAPGETAFPIVGSRRQSLRSAPTFFRLRVLMRLPGADSDFTGSGARKFLTGPSGSCGLRLPICPARSSTELSRYETVVGKVRSQV
ncbi:hypothetical protein STH2382 [Symbiobacterium thermophilum IAM 14863]|uniref:Uncharacterized protein n=1 Tax=Symbiobacterium thermophilum (strain DSM 24528 / JCM 14929 / IAM 14863 / T) TaxID=292459 RepID=Q67LS9_SYMTH|nr:hypothetical protein STH2382 [Symbiobacterium thermophilum IAM 14863]